MVSSTAANLDACPWAPPATPRSQPACATATQVNLPNLWAPATVAGGGARFFFEAFARTPRERNATPMNIPVRFAHRDERKNFHQSRRSLWITVCIRRNKKK